MLDKEEMQNLLSELLDEETPSRSRITEIASEIRDSYYESHDQNESLTETNNRLTEENYDISITNSQLFRQLSSERRGKSREEEEKEKEQSVSETITIEDFEKGVAN